MNETQKYISDKYEAQRKNAITLSDYQVLDQIFAAYREYTKRPTDHALDGLNVKSYSKDAIKRLVAAGLIYPPMPKGGTMPTMKAVNCAYPVLINDRVVPAYMVPSLTNAVMTK